MGNVLKGSTTSGPAPKQAGTWNCGAIIRLESAEDVLTSEHSPLRYPQPPPFSRQLRLNEVSDYYSTYKTILLTRAVFLHRIFYDAACR